jgi:hypothetical protein
MDYPVELIEQLTTAIGRLNEISDQLSDRLAEVETQLAGINHAPRSPWVDKIDAGAIVHRHPQTLDKWRADESRGLTEGVHWQNDGGKVVYHAEMLADWYNHQADPEVHLANIAHARSAMPLKKRGRPRKELA